ncbi:MAG: hypothetical protein JO127_17100 [Caulobacteraceae bacterium]|nr:hypothetical protein [Caulobacteraceae bacterium]
MGRTGAILKSAWALALLCALALRALCPTGWMPGPDPGSGAWLVICTGHGPATPNDGHDKPWRKEGGRQERCAFSGFVQAPAPPPPPLLAPPRFALAPAPAFLIRPRVASLERPRGPSARGPPFGV